MSIENRRSKPLADFENECWRCPTCEANIDIQVKGDIAEHCECLICKQKLDWNM